MALDVSRSGTRGRRPSNRGVSYSYVRNGLEITAKWPRSRGRSLKANTREQMEYFRQVQDAFKLMDPKLAIAIRNAVAGTPLMPRDLFLKAISGRLAYFIEPNGRRVFSMAGMKSVSDNLDILGQVTGDLLFRGLELWERLEIGDEGQVLTVGPDLMPVWAAGGGGGGGAPWVEVASVAMAGLPLIDFTDLDQFQDLMMIGRGVSNSTSAYRSVLISTDNGASFYNASGDYIRISTAGTPSNQIQCDATSAATAGAASFMLKFEASNLVGTPKFIWATSGLNTFLAASTDPISALRYKPLSGNATAGTITMLGRPA